MSETIFGDAPAPRLVPLTKLRPSPRNPRTITEASFRKLCDALRADPEFLWRRPVLAYENGEIYAGTQRYRAAADIGWASIPAIVEDVPASVAEARRVRDNNQWGEWADDDLGILLHELAGDGVDLDSLGFGAKQLEALLESVGGGSGREHGGDDTLTERYDVIVQCADEADQAELLDRLTAEGRTCRALLS